MQFGDKYIAKRIILISRSAMTLEEAMTQTQGEDRVFIVGGQSIFEQTIEIISGIWMVRMYQNYNGDAFYPRLPDDMKLVKIMPYGSEGKFAHCYYERDWSVFR